VPVVNDDFVKVVEEQFGCGWNKFTNRGLDCDVLETEGLKR